MGALLLQCDLVSGAAGKKPPPEAPKSDALHP